MPLRGIPLLFGGRRGAGGAPPVTPNLLTGVTNGTPRSNFDGCVGFEWLSNAPASPPTITHLSRWKRAGNSQTHTLYLIRVTGGFTIVDSVSVDMATGSDGSWVSTALGSPFTLSSAAVVYGIMSSEINGGDGWYNDDTSIGGLYSADFSAQGSIYDTNTPPTSSTLNTSGLFTFVPVNAVLTP